MICTEMYPLHFLWHFESTFYSNKVHGGEQDSLAPERMATASLFFGRHLMMPWFPEELRYTASRAVCDEGKTVKRLLVAGHDHFSQT